MDIKDLFAYILLQRSSWFYYIILFLQIIIIKTFKYLFDFIIKKYRILLI